MTSTMIRSCSIALAMAMVSIGSVAGASAEETGAWRPLYICKSGIPDSTRVFAVFKITKANAGALRKNIEAGLLAKRKRAMLLGKVKGTLQSCGKSTWLKDNKRYQNTPIGGPLTIRITSLAFAPLKFNPAGKGYVLSERRFKNGLQFMIMGKPVK